MNTETLHLPPAEVAAEPAIVTMLPLTQRHLKPFQDAHFCFRSLYGSAPSVNEIAQIYLAHASEDDVVKALECTVLGTIREEQPPDERNIAL